MWPRAQDLRTLSVIDLATARPKGKARAEAVLNLAFGLLSEQDGSKNEPAS